MPTAHGQILDKHASRLAAVALNDRERRNLFLRGLWRFRPDWYDGAMEIPVSWKEKPKRVVRIKHLKKPQAI